MAERKQMKPQDVREEAFPDPDEPKGEQAGLSLVLIIGGVFLAMIITMVAAFIYFQNNVEGPTSFVAPALLAHIVSSVA